MKYLLGLIFTMFILLLYVQYQQFNGPDNFDNDQMQLAIRARALERYGEYND